MTYNGWKNKETWTVNLWLSNDEYSYFAVTNGARTRTVDELADHLKTSCEDLLDEIENLKTGMFRDLLISALEDVDWHEIAAGFKEDEE